MKTLIPITGACLLLAFGFGEAIGQAQTDDRRSTGSEATVQRSLNGGDDEPVVPHVRPSNANGKVRTSPVPTAETGATSPPIRVRQLRRSVGVWSAYAKARLLPRDSRETGRKPSYSASLLPRTPKSRSRSAIELAARRDPGKQAAYQNISAWTAWYKMASAHHVVFVDVREQSEVDRWGHIPNAIFMPWNTGYLRAHHQELPDMGLIVYCQSGGRSAAASQFLVDNGRTEVYNMLGGYPAWPGDQLKTSARSWRLYR